MTEVAMPLNGFLAPSLMKAALIYCNKKRNKAARISCEIKWKRTLPLGRNKVVILSCYHYSAMMTSRINRRLQVRNDSKQKNKRKSSSPRWNRRIRRLPGRLRLPLLPKSKREAICGVCCDGRGFDAELWDGKTMLVLVSGCARISLCGSKTQHVQRLLHD